MNTGSGLPGIYPLRVEGRLIAMLDIAFPPEQVYVEPDGRRFHSDRRVFRIDRVRNNEIAAVDWLGLRLSRDEFEQAPQRFLAQLAATLEARRRALCGASAQHAARMLHT